MKSNSLTAFAFGFALLGAANSFGQTQAVTDPVGFVSVTVPANSDAYLAVPMNRASAFKGVIQSISGNVVTVSGTSPAWATSPMQFVQSLPTQPNTYALQLASGMKEGMIAKVTANGSNSVTVQLSPGDDMVGVKTEAVDGLGQGDHIDIMPYWTPSTLLSSASIPAGTQILAFQNPGAGINLGNSEQYTSSGPGTWEDDINFGEEGTHVPFAFGASFILRNNSGAAINLSFVGSVPMATHRIRLTTLANNLAQDIAFGFMSPIPEKLSSIGDPLIPVPQQTANFLQFPVSVGDQILGFDNSQTGINKGNSVQYTWNGAEWEDDINFGEVASYQTTLKPGFGYIYRRAAGATASSFVWSRLPSYLQ